MRTAAEIINASDSLCVEDVFEIQDIIDEAVAHGMTLAAATAKPVAASGSLADYRELPHVRARKTK